MNKIFNYENYQWVSTPNFELDGIGTVRCETYNMEINDFFEKYKDRFIYIFAIKDGAIKAHISETMHMPLPNAYIGNDDLQNLSLFVKRLVDEDTLEDELLVAVARDFMYYVYGSEIDDYISYHRKKGGDYNYVFELNNVFKIDQTGLEINEKIYFCATMKTPVFLKMIKENENKKHYVYKINAYETRFFSI